MQKQHESLMLNYIIQALKDIPILVPVTSHLYKGSMDYLQYIILGKDRKWHVFELVFNDVNLLGIEQEISGLLTGSTQKLQSVDKYTSDFSTSIMQCHRIYNTLDEAKSKVLQNPKHELPILFNKLEDDLKSIICNIVVPEISIGNINVSFKPVITITVSYLYKNMMRKPLAIVVGSGVLDINNLEGNEVQFRNKLNELLGKEMEICNL